MSSPLNREYWTWFNGEGEIPTWYDTREEALAQATEFVTMYPSLSAGVFRYIVLSERVYGSDYKGLRDEED